MNLITCIMRNSVCYRGTTTAKPVGIVWHDTGAGNPNICRYVQPDPDDPKRSELLKKIGRNENGNDWNHPDTEDKGVNAFIGRLADGSIATVQTLPWNYRAWGVASGWNGSLNGTTGGKMWIQFEICDDGYRSKDYFQKVYQEAVEFTAYLCRLYDIDPMGSVTYNGVKVPTVLCHQDAYRLGFGSNHGDVLDWFGKFGATMAQVRKDVNLRMEDDMTREETQKLIDDALTKQSKQLTTKISKAISEALDDALGPMIGNYTDIKWEGVREEVGEMVRLGVIDGGTDKAVNPDDVNMRLQLLRVLVVAKRYVMDVLTKLPAGDARAALIEEFEQILAALRGKE